MANILHVLLAGLQIQGYVDNRPFVAIGDSLVLGGYVRAWVGLKSAMEFYGADAALDLLLPYDASFDLRPDAIEIGRLAAWVGPYDRRLTAGRQLIDWGTARVLKCLDFFNRTDYFEPGYEKKGVDAVLAEWAFGQRAGARLLGLPRLDPARTLFAGRQAFGIGPNDFGLNGYYRSQPKLIAAGIDIAGEFHAGYWIEGACWQDDSAGYFKSTIGADYTMPLPLYVMAEYFHDQSGVSDPAHYDFGLLASGARSTLARDYLYLSLGAVSGLLLRPAVNAVVNLDDGGLILIPNLFLALYDNVDVNLGAHVAVGDRTSEFANISPFNTVLFSWLRVYF